LLTTSSLPIFSSFIKSSAAPPANLGKFSYFCLKVNGGT
jgi:hypothetical protein